jgi:DNA-directed RNA polymerase specialized sigma24 family protein
MTTCGRAIRTRISTSWPTNTFRAAAHHPKSSSAARPWLRVRAAVARLPVGQRQTLTLVDLEEFSYAEVGEILGIPIGTVMSRLCRGRRALRDELLRVEPIRRFGE